MAVEQLGGLTALGAVLSPLDGAGLRTDAVVARISAAIGLGVITDGEQLPSEIDLANQLGVSTMTLREALAVLREQGLVHTKRGRGGGSFIRSSAEAVNSRSLARLAQLSVEELRDIGDEHMAVAGTAAVLAARRGVDADFGRLRALAQRLADTDDPVHGKRADSRFQIEVAVCSQSARLTRAEVNLQAELSALVWLPKIGLDRKERAEQHLALSKAIAGEDETAARLLAEQRSAADVRRLIALRMELSGS